MILFVDFLEPPQKSWGKKFVSEILLCKKKIWSTFFFYPKIFGSEIYGLICLCCVAVLFHHCLLLTWTTTTQSLCWWVGGGGGLAVATMSNLNLMLGWVLPKIEVEFYNSENQKNVPIIWNLTREFDPADIRTDRAGVWNTLKPIDT